MAHDTDGLMREVLAEFLGTFVLLLIGLGVVAQVVLSRNTAGTYLSINLAWGLAVTMGCYVAGGVSGAHLNPAVTIALAVRRGFSWGKVGPYIIAQVAGAFVASAVVFLTYAEALNAFDGGVRQVAGAQATAGIWATYPQAFLTTFPGGFSDQFVATALLMGVIFAISDARNTPPAAGMAPFIVGLLVMAIGMSFGFNAGYAINPARDFGPRLFTAVAGWGSEVFRAGNSYWWVPIVAPIAGAVAGGWLYDVMIGNRFPGHQSPMSAASHTPVPQPGQLPPDAQ
jgi:MIP family channel proteins